MDRRYRIRPQGEMESFIEIVSNNLYFAVLKGMSVNRHLKGDGEMFYFTIDDELLYHNYYLDFGPLNISCVYKYCMKVNKYLQYARGMKAVVHYTISHPEKKANAIFLMGCYCVLYLKMSPKDALRLFQETEPIKPFLDASQFPCQFAIKMIDCFQAIAKAQAFNFFNFEDFNASEYDLYNKLEFGDLNWLLPRKFLAFIGPADNRTAHPPEFYIKYFLKNDVKTVIRLNNVLYDAYTFMQVGIQHYDLIFPDGTTPPKDILLKFLYIAETAPAAIAVHCKAGLGRTGSLIGAYLIKHYRLTAREAIAWLRICRPGSVIGQQQLWLEKIQSWLWRIGSQYRLQNYGEGDKIPRHKYGIYSKTWPMEREKAIRENRQKIQTKFTSVQLENCMQAQKKLKISSIERLLGTEAKLYPSSGDSFKNISKLLCSMHGLSRTQDPTHSHTKVRPQSRSEKCINCVNVELSPRRVVKKSSKEEQVKKPVKTAAVKLPSQGDKLNQIKAMRFNRTKKVGGRGKQI
ncbi:dual specificity protein phosphatase CDC14C-like isoform X2 [Anthonomus grandis grandis]|uniref:dual specificity protein phosphatase CDC14C-like isoform X2 n=1 Tax=Anthonomus grandis grandis TaxID=2921223 RepID=UPI00216684CB|nr:dual specificity protein phosphatase CDC14C-like isoform X2 [Anthonomus grandis grandis]